MGLEGISKGERILTKKIKRSRIESEDTSVFKRVESWDTCKRRDLNK